MLGASVCGRPTGVCEPTFASARRRCGRTPLPGEIRAELASLERVSAVPRAQVKGGSASILGAVPALGPGVRLRMSAGRVRHWTRACARDGVWSGAGHVRSPPLGLGERRVERADSTEGERHRLGQEAGRGLPNGPVARRGCSLSSSSRAAADFRLSRLFLTKVAGAKCSTSLTLLATVNSSEV
jgi:hypothetical protein